MTALPTAGVDLLILCLLKKFLKMWVYKRR